MRDTELIHGYKGLQVDITYNSQNLSSFFRVTHQGEAREGADDVKGDVARHLPDALKSIGNFKRGLNESFAPCGTPTHSYQRGGDTFDVYRASFEDQTAREHHVKFNLFILMFIDGSSVIDHQVGVTWHHVPCTHALLSDLAWTGHTLACLHHVQARCRWAPARGGVQHSLPVCRDGGRAAR
jgi:hypothetical protein